MTARCYAACLDAADWAEARRWWVLAVGAPIMLVLLLAVARVVLQAFPNSGDEYTYLYQAATMAEGRLSNPLPPAPEFFETYYLVQRGDRTFGSFPFGWPLLLSLAMRAGIPPVLVNPVLGVVSLWLLYLLGRALYGARVGMLAAAAMAVSPFFVFNAASYFSHAWCGCLLLGAAYCAVLAVRRHVCWAVMVGVLVGWAVVSRYLTGAVVGTAILIWLLRHGVGRRSVVLALTALGGLPWVAGLAWYNAALTGDAWALTTMPATVSLWFADGVLLRGPDILATQLVALLLWMPPLLMVAYVFALRRGRPSARHPELTWLLALMAGVLVFYLNRGGNQYGPRFYYEATLFALPAIVAYLFADATFDQKPVRDRRLWLGAMISIGCVPLMFAAHLTNVWHIVRERQEPYEAVAHAGLDHAIVLLSGRIGRRRSMDARDLVRNDFAFINPVLFARDPGTGACAITAAFPGRAVYRYERNDATGKGELIREGC